MNEYDIADAVWRFLSECDWVSFMDPAEDSILITVDGKDYRISFESEAERLKKAFSDDDIREMGFDLEKSRWGREEEANER